MKVTAKADYAVRAVLELATVDEGLVKGERIAQAQGIPLKFLENILIDLRHAGIVHASAAPRAATGWRARPTRSRSARSIRAVEGPLASVRGEPPESVLDYAGAGGAPADRLGRRPREPARRARRPDARRRRRAAACRSAGRAS